MKIVRWFKENPNVWPLLITVMAGYISAFTNDEYAYSPLETGLLVVIGIIYVGLGLQDLPDYGKDRLALRIGYLATLATLAGLIIYIGRGYPALAIVPIAGYCVALLSRRLAVVSIAVLILEIVVIYTFLSGSFGRASITAISVGAALLFVGVFTDLAIREVRSRAQVEQLAQELSEANHKLRDYAAQAEELATIKERNRLAREIHDSLGHYLTVVNMQLEAARTVIGSDQNKALNAIDKAQTLTKEGLAEVRHSVAALRASPTENVSLLDALKKLVDDNTATGIVTDLSVTGTPRPLSAQTELTLYRAAQECLNNVRKHSHASTVKLELHYCDDGRVKLRVQDNGVGSDKPDGGFGLVGVRERVALLHGQVQIQTAPGQGFALEAELPA